MSGDSSLSAELRERLERRREPDADGRFDVDVDETYVGDTVTLTGRDLEPNELYEVTWHTAVGS